MFDKPTSLFNLNHFNNFNNMISMIYYYII